MEEIKVTENHADTICGAIYVVYTANQRQHACLMQIYKPKLKSLRGFISALFIFKGKMTLKG